MKVGSLSRETRERRRMFFSFSSHPCIFSDSLGGALRVQKTKSSKSLKFCNILILNCLHVVTRRCDNRSSRSVEKCCIRES